MHMSLVPIEARGFGSTQSTGSCELPDVGAETQIQVLCKTNVNSFVLLANEPYLQAIKVPGWPELLILPPCLFNTAHQVCHYDQQPAV